mgnify:CR=1 FL=1
MFDGIAIGVESGADGAGVILIANIGGNPDELCALFDENRCFSVCDEGEVVNEFGLLGLCLESEL